MAKVKLRQRPALQRCRLVECARFLLEKCQIVPGIEGELATPV